MAVEPLRHGLQSCVAVKSPDRKFDVTEPRALSLRLSSPMRCFGLGRDINKCTSAPLVATLAALVLLCSGTLSARVIVLQMTGAARPAVLMAVVAAQAVL